MVAQSLTIDEGYAHALVWRGLVLFRAMGIGVAAGFVAGFVAGGVGSRLAMKLVALVAGPDARGRTTENGNTIGVFSSDTIFLLIMGASIGTLGGLLYMALRLWLARAGRWRGLAFGAVLLALGGALIIEEPNFDFTRFGIPVLNVALFAALYLVFGIIVAPLADWLDRRSPAIIFAEAGRLGVGGAFGIAALAALPALLVLGAVLGVGGGLLVLAAPLCAVAGLVGLGARFFPAGAARRLPRLGGYLLTTSLGLIGFIPLAVVFVGLGFNGEERGETRLVAAALLLLIAGALGGRLWSPREGAGAGRWSTTLLLAIPVLVGLSVTLREVGAIVFAR